MRYKTYFYRFLSAQERLQPVKNEVFPISKKTPSYYPVMIFDLKLFLIIIKELTKKITNLYTLQELEGEGSRNDLLIFFLFSDTLLNSIKKIL